jgi:DNA-binding transcriptional LysR family regulator
MIDLNSLKYFDSVVNTGSFTRAADRLGVAKAKVSVQIARLEQQLGVALLTRTTRQVLLTDAGRSLHQDCQPLLRGLEDALAQAGSEQGELSGTLRLSTTTIHATQSVAPAIARFAVLHPALRVDLRTGDRIADLVADGIDLSFRMGWLRDSSQRAIKMGEFRQFVVASPAYIAQHGRPKTPAQLADHEWIALSLMSTPHTWKFEHPEHGAETVHVKSRIQVDSPATLLSLVAAGAGISVLEENTIRQALAAGELARLLQAWSLPAGGIYAVLPPGRHVPPKVRAFIDFYREFLKRN